MRLKRTAAVVLSALAVTAGLVVVVPGAASATEPGTDGLLAALSPSGTVIGNADGTAQHVPTGLANAQYVTWSSDGSRIAWRNRFGNSELMVSDPDGTNQVWIPGAVGGPPTWYDSNTKLVFATTAASSGVIHSQLYVVSMLDPGVRTPLFATDTGCSDGAPSARGNLVVFTRGCPRTDGVAGLLRQVWIYDKTTGAAHEVLDNAFDADISPDGTHIVFVRPTTSQPDVFESLIDGSGVTQLTTTGATQGRRHAQPVWSPSGTHIVYWGTGSNGALETTAILDPATGTERVWLAPSIGPPSWQPINPFAPKPPTPISSTPPPLVLALSASTGDADSSGQTSVTLDASHTAGAGGDASYSFDFGDGRAALVSSTPVVTRPEAEGTYRVTVTVKDSWGRTSTSTPQWFSVSDGYHPVTPARLLDTRSGLGAPVGSMKALTLQLPATVTANTYGPLRAVVLNVTVTQPTSYGNIKVYPDGLAKPDTSNLNFTAGLTVANLVTVPVTNGKVTLFVESPGSAHLIADLSGYYTAGTSGSGFASLTPSPIRVLDTRNGTGGVGGRVGAGGTLSVPVPLSVPDDATAVVMNATAVDTSSYGNLTVYPDAPGQAAPTTSSLNFNAKGTVPNLVIVPISANRRIDFRVDSPGSADLIADVEGFFSPGSALGFVPRNPTRLFDTRNGDAGGVTYPGGSVAASIASALGMPPTVLSAALYNVTVTQPTGHGFITVYADGQPYGVPNVSNLNYSEGQTVANAVLAPLANGTELFYNGGTGTTHLIGDLFGYFATPVIIESPPVNPGEAKATIQARK